MRDKGSSMDRTGSQVQSQTFLEVVKLLGDKPWSCQFQPPFRSNDCSECNFSCSSPDQVKKKGYI